MIRSLLTAGLGCLLIATTQPAHAQQGWPDWLQRDMQRESDEMTAQAVRTGDEVFRFRLPGTPGTPSAFDGGWYTSTDIGAGSPLECYILEEDTDLGALVLRMTDLNIDNVATRYDKVENSRSLFAIDAGGIDGSPYLAPDIIYTAGISYRCNHRDSCCR